MPAAVLALALGAFGIGMTEFVPIGLLPQMARDFGASIPQVGWVVTVYAGGVLLGVLPLTALGLRMRRRKFLILLMAIFVLGNIVTALATNLPFALGGRLITSFAHGAFYGTGSVVAASLVSPERRSAAIAAMFTGLTLSNLIGVPLGTWLSDTTSWRMTFYAMSALGVIAAIALARYMPNGTETTRTRLRDELGAARDIHVILAMLATLLGFGGVFASITYLAPMMTEVTGFPESSMTWLLAILGGGMVVGNWLGGKLADRALMPTVAGSLILLALSLFAFTFTAAVPLLAVISIFVVGAAGFATVAPLQAIVMRRAALAPNLSSALNIGAFNTGNALAAWLGGLAIGSGFGYAATNWVGGLMTLSGLACVAVSVLLTSKRRRRSSFSDEPVRSVPNGESGSRATPIK